MKKTRQSYQAGPKDNCGTPAYALDPLIPFLPRTLPIWEPACGAGRIVDALIPHGFEVIYSDIAHPTCRIDFLTTTLGSRISAIVTNPPYSSPLKGKFIQRCFDLGYPFALLVQVDTLGMKSFQRAAQGKPFEIMLLSERIDFYMPEKGYTKGGSPFSCLWLCSGLLPEKVMFGKITKLEGM